MVTTRRRATEHHDEELLPPPVIESPPRSDAVYHEPPMTESLPLLPPIADTKGVNIELPQKPRRRPVPPSYSPRCTGCAQRDAPAAVWCCECERNLCWECDERLHDVSNGNGLDAYHRPMCSHRVEQIVDGGGVAILTPCLEMATLALCAMIARPLLSAAGGMLNVDYFFESVCPTVSRFRRWIFRLDHALYPILRPVLSTWCDTEDSFIKIFVDTWVRGVLTATDSYALIVMKAPAALGALIVIIAFSPLIAIPFAAFATALRLIELVVIPNWAICRFIATIIGLIKAILWFPPRLAAWFCRCTILGLIMDSDFRAYFHLQRPLPPETGRRLRPTPSFGIRDITMGGCVSRVMRVFRYYHHRTQHAITGLILTAVLFAVVARVTLLGLDRCGGQGILSAPASITVQEVMDPELNEQCISVHSRARQLATRVGVRIPEMQDLGNDADMLTSLQASTENDYIDHIFRLACIGTIHRILSYPLYVRFIFGLILFTVCFAGLIRRLLHWADLRRRYRSFDRLMDKFEAAFDDLDDGSEVSVENGQVSNGEVEDDSCGEDENVDCDPTTDETPLDDTGQVDEEDE